VKASSKEGDTLGVDSTPTIFINGEKISGAAPVQAMLPIVNRALRSAGVAVPYAAETPDPAKPRPKTPIPRPRNKYQASYRILFVECIGNVLCGALGGNLRPSHPLKKTILSIALFFVGRGLWDACCPGKQRGDDTVARVNGERSRVPKWEILCESDGGLPQQR